MGQFTWIFIKIACTVLGKSLVSAVFFADGMMDTMHRFHYVEEQDRLETHHARLWLTNDLHTLWPDHQEKEQKDPDAVHPVERNASDLDAKLEQLQAAIETIKKRKTERQGATKDFKHVNAAMDLAVEFLSAAAEPDTDAGQAKEKTDCDPFSVVLQCQRWVALAAAKNQQPKASTAGISSVS